MEMERTYENEELLICRLLPGVLTHWLSRIFILKFKMQVGSISWELVQLDLGADFPGSSITLMLPFDLIILQFHGAHSLDPLFSHYS